MKQVVVLRHAPKNDQSGLLTDEGIILAKSYFGKIGSFDLLISSDQKRTQDTIYYLTRQKPRIDLRAGLADISSGEREYLYQQASIHPQKYTGVLYEHQNIRSLLHKKALELIEVIKETLGALSPNGRALICSHDITMVPAYQILIHYKMLRKARQFNLLGGFIVDENMDVQDLSFIGTLG